MSHTSLRKLRSRAIVALSCVTQIALLLGAFVQPDAALAAGGTACATPGKDGSPASITGVVNTYYPGTSASLAAGSTSIPVGTSTGSSTAIAAGDLLLVVQMQNATINATNTSAYGAGTTTGTGSTSTTAGKYEYVTATAAVTGGAVAIKGANGGGLVNAYFEAAKTSTQGQATYQVIRVPQYGTTTLTSGLTAQAWNGSTGGVLAIDTTGALALGGATVSVNSLGFRGGAVLVGAGSATPTGTDYRNLNQYPAHGEKAEGIAGTPANTFNGTAITTGTGDGYPNGDKARGAPGNAGGGGTDPDPKANDQNTGGGGGGNGGAGGQGGNSWSSNLPEGGLGGSAFAASVTQVVLGGGGGSGSNNNGTNAPNGSSGGPGGGMVFVRAGSVSGTGTITANGGPGIAPVNDGGGGGGAGGSIVVLTGNNSTTGLTANAIGGRGSDADLPPSSGTSDPHGPGGGGAGGVVVTSGGATTNVAGGAHGLTGITGATIAYNSTSGGNGSATTSTLATSPGSTADTTCSTALTVTKSVNTANVARSGAIVYTIVVTNSGPGQADGTTFTDVVPTGVTVGTVSCGSPTTFNGYTAACNSAAPTVSGQTVSSTITTLPPGTSVTFTINGTAASGASYSDTATATPPAFYGLAATSSNTVVTKVDPKVTVAKTASASTALQGSTISYAIVVTNASDTAGISADGTVLSDTVPSNFTNVSVVCGSPTNGAVCPTGAITVTTNAFSSTIPTLPQTGTVTYTVTATATTAGSTTNTATIAAATGTVFDPTSTTSASASITIATTANLVVNKTAPANVIQNGTIAYTIVVTNNGPSAANGTTVNDAIPTAITVSSITCGSATGGAVCPGTITASNTLATSVPTLPSGGSVTFTINGTSSGTTTLSNTATIAAPSGVTAGPNSTLTSTATTTITPVTALSITKTGPAQATVSGLIAYSILVSNAGPSAASGATFSDPVPPGIAIKGTPTCTVTSGAATCGTVTVSGQTVSSTITTFPANSSVTFSIFGSSSATSGTAFTNTATITPPTGSSDPNPATSSVTTTLIATGVVKTVRNLNNSGETANSADTGKPGDILEYVLSFTNNTGAAISGFAFSDPTPQAQVGPPATFTTYVKSTCGTLPTGITACTPNAGNVGVGASGTITWNFTGTLAVGSTLTATLQVKIP